MKNNNHTQEEWKEIIGYKKSYFVSDLGNVIKANGIKKVATKLPHGYYKISFGKYKLRKDKKTTIKKTN